MDVIGQKNPDPKTGRDVGPETFPVKRFSIEVDTSLVRKNGTVNMDDSILSNISFELRKNYLDRNELIILNIIAANGWKRPIYFTSPFGLGFDQYLRKDGMAYRLVPVEDKLPQANWVTEQAMRQMGIGGTQIKDDNTDFMYNSLMNKFAFGGADKKGTYFDEENRRHLLNLRALYGEAAGNMADLGRKEEAQKLIDKCEAGMLTENFPYAMVSRFNSHNQTALLYLEACYKAGKMELAEKVRQATRKDLEQQKKYYDYIKANRFDLYGGFERTEVPINERMLLVLDAIEKKYAPQLQPKTNVSEGNSTITNSVKPDSAKNKDSVKQH
jgi:hypothetical protein